MKAKNILKTLALPVAVALGMMATSCSSDDNIVNEQQAGAAKYEIPVTVSVTRSGDDATRATFNETSKKLEFEEGDKLFIQGTDATAGTFAGVLSNTSGATGTFSGTVATTNGYTGTFSALFASATSLTATLLPKNYSTEAAGYLTLSGEGANQTLTVDATKAFVTAASADAAKALAIEQLSLEQATTYSSGFALTPVNAVLNYSISGLANSTGYTPSVSDATTAISGSVTSDATGNACFAVAFAPAGSKTYTLSISGFSDIAVADKALSAGKVYKKTATVAPGVPFDNVTSSHKGYYIAKNGKAYSTKALANTYSTAVGYICYVGSVPGYFDNFIAIALNDAHTTYTTYSDAQSKVGTYASNNAVTVGSITYNTNSGSSGSSCYDVVTNSTSTASNTRTGSAVKGWRIPTVTDWRYIFAGFSGPSATSPVGVGAGSPYPYGNGSTLRSAINTACGNTALQSNYYWSSSELSGNTDYAWYYAFNRSCFSSDYKTSIYYVRAVFAY